MCASFDINLINLDTLKVNLYDCRNSRYIKKSTLKKLLGFLKIKGLKYPLRGDCLALSSIS